MRSWRGALIDAIRANPRLSGTLALELGLLLYATLKARRGRSATMPPVETVIEALPVIAAAAVTAPAITHKTTRRRRSRARG
jgi:hypothetical protein